MSLNFEMIAGNSKTLHTTATDREGTVIPLVDVATMTWGLFDLDGNLKAQKTLGDGIAITGDVAGEYDVDLDDTDTVDLLGDYCHDVKITYISGSVMNLRNDLDLAPGEARFLKNLINTIA